MSDHPQVQFTRVEAGAAGQRLDNFLLAQLKGCPKSRIYRMIRKGEVRLNRKRARPDSRVAEGDMVRIPPVRLAERTAPPKPGASLADLLQNRILLENDDFLVIDKPAGLAVHGGSGVRLGLIEALRQIRPEWQSLELVHRLDRDTSGCLIVAKNSIFLKEINRQLKNKSVSKIYLALVQGFWPDTLHEIDAPLQKYRLESGEGMVRVADEGKPALTRFRVLEHFGRLATLVEVQLETGRTHQIRVHCRHAGHAILGDAKYGSRDLPAALQGVQRLCLHAARLEFSYPSGGPGYRIEAALDADFEATVKLLRSQ
ncbi:MAG: RluA family pseudouridine synthase [Gammaproteobacteria bacterium]|nr:RluA family pseudouridine synthase [Pseudomonadales bacterium]MCP5346256.1 RluA family pseudouridine synthase [Pseudomonadales bacterium]